MDFPPQVPVKVLDAQGPDASKFAAQWESIRILRAGAQDLKDAVQQFLVKRPKELTEVYLARSGRITYSPVLGNILGWYRSAMFKDSVQFAKSQSTDATFTDAFERDCDRAGTSYVDFLGQVLEHLVLYRRSYVLIDLPPFDVDTPAESLDEQIRRGQLDAYVCAYPPASVVAYDTDSYGNIEWITLKVSQVERESPLSGQTAAEYWYLFDRQQVALYQRSYDPNSSQKNEFAKLAEGYPRPHALALQGRVPVRVVEVPEDLWIANRIWLMLIKLFNHENGLDWALEQANLAMPVIKGRYDTNLTLSEVGYIHLPDPDGDISWFEPSGVCFEHSANRIEQLHEAIYRAAYLQDQGRSSKATPAMQSGYSKELDKMPARDAMAGFGRVLRAGAQAVYQDVIDIRGLDIKIDVRGFDFRDKASQDDLAFMEQSTVIDIQSDTYRRERDKKFVRLVLADANPETLTAIDNEIMANPTPEGAAEAAKAEQQLAMQKKFEAALSRPQVQ